MTNYSPLSPTLREILALRNFQAAISEIFGDSNATSSNPNSVRAGLMNAQCVVGELLKALGHSAEHVDKFYMLAEALGDLDVGSVHPLFRGAKHRVLQPTRFAVRPPDTSEKARQRACVVLALIALVSAGRNKQQAATFLAKQHKNISRIAGAKSKNLKAPLSSGTRPYNRKRSSIQRPWTSTMSKPQKLQLRLEPCRSKYGSRKPRIWLDEWSRWLWD